MFLKYVGIKKNLTLTMPWLVGGPYMIDGPDSVIEVYDADGDLLMQRSGPMFEVVDKVAVEKTVDDRLQCPYCDKDYASESGLRKHIRAMHPESIGESLEVLLA